MLPEPPQVPVQPCPACGRLVDPLRASRVLCLEDGIRFLCDEACRTRFLGGERGFDVPSRARTRPEQPERPSIPDLVREATFVRHGSEAGETDGPRGRGYDPLLALGLAVLALGIVIATSTPALGWLSAFLVALCAAVNARTPVRHLRASGSLHLVAPVGLALAALASVLAESPEEQRWSLMGAAVAGIAVSLRNWIHGSMRQPARALRGELLDTLPVVARIPAATPSAYEEIPVTQVQQGDLLVVLESECAPADGVIEEGAGVGLLYPKAAHSRPYAEGDFILAGTRIIEGAVTIRIRRTGRERGIVRAAELGALQQRDSAAASRARLVVADWSWLALGPAALLLLAWIGPSAAAAWLLGVPVLAVLASLEAPLDAGALASARRGMLFGSARALRDASHTNIAAIVLRGALTVGEPIVQQAKSLGAMKLDRVLALAAAAERAAEGHPIARAIQRHVEEHDYGSASVRREQAVSGLGVVATSSQGVPVVVGRRQLLLDEGISVAAADQEAKHIESEGLTPIFIAVDGTLEALLALLDPTHVGARDAIQRITDLPCEAIVISGDDRGTVERIAAHLGAPRVKAPLLPQERVNEVRALRETGGVVAVIGRGGEDDSVLAAADVPVSLRLVGTATEERGIVVASRDVRDAAAALWIARAVKRSTWRSLGACLAATMLVAAGASLGWMPPVAAALVAAATEAWTVRAGSRLLRRVDLRVPTRQ
jgi:cation transport ATPase